MSIRSVHSARAKPAALAGAQDPPHEIFLVVIWFWILITVFIDIFRSPDLSGVAKALWFMFVLFIPLIGVLVYLIARGGSMSERSGCRRRSGGGPGCCARGTTPMCWCTRAGAPATSNPATQARPEVGRTVVVSIPAVVDLATT